MFPAIHRLRTLLKCTRGIATSLLEATATITVSVTLASAAVVVVSQAVQSAKIARAQQETTEISSAFNSFYNDMLHYPIFFSGADTGPTQPTADVIRSTQGDKAEIQGSASTPFIIDKTKFDSTPGDITASRNWNDDDQGSFLVLTDFESQLNANTPVYKKRGQLDDPTRGFNGPYFEAVPPTDPWGNKYYVNARFLNPVKTISKELGDQSIKITVLSLSAGPNESIQTPFGLNPTTTGGSTTLLGNVKAEGDDITARIR